LFSAVIFVLLFNILNALTMKKFTLFILFALLSGALSAQSETTRRSGFFDNILHAIPMDDGNILVLQQRYPKTPEVYMMNGEDLSRIFPTIFDFNSFPFTSIYEVEGIALGTDDSVYIIGRAGSCDYTTGERHLVQMDLNGNGGVIKTYTNYYPNWPLTFDNALQTGPNGGVWVNEGDDWQDVWVLYDGQGNVVNGYNGIYDAWNSQSSAGVILASGDLLLLRSNVLELYDSQLNLLHTATTGQLFGSRGERPIVTSDSQYIYVYSAGDPRRLTRLDYNLQGINQVNWDIGDDVQAMIAHDNDSLTVIGNDYQHIYTKKISNGFNFVDTNPDVGIVKILDADITYDCTGYYGACGYNVKNSEIIVQNFGTQPVTSFEVNVLYYSGGGIGCELYCDEDHVYYSNGYGLTLMPGEQDTVTFSDMHLCIDEEIISSLCFYMTRPNGIVDRNHTNDDKCAEFETFLPIELLSPLKANIKNQTAVLTWETATETNNEGFEIQKSRDGSNWEKIGWVAGRGDALTSHAYTYRDENLLSGTTYYRFKQLDFDGTFTYSNVVNVQQATTNISIHPNPVKNTLYINNLNGNTIQYIHIFDQMGRRVVDTKTVESSIDVSNLTTGIYLIEIQMEGGVLREKIVVE